MLASLLLAWNAQSQPAVELPLFEDVSAQALPGVRTTCGAREKNWILEVNGGGVLLGDFNNDEHIDLVIIDGSTIERARAGEPGFPPRLFFGRGEGSFEPAGSAWQMEGGRWGMGGATADLDGDGWLDLALTQWGATRILRNRAGQGFEELASCATSSDQSWGTSAAFLDYDRDGVLDLAVANYLEFVPERVPARGSQGCHWKGHAVLCGPEGLQPMHDQLLRGRGDGKFEDVTAVAGLRAAAAGFGLGVMPLDYDCDGDSDLYVANDSTPNHLWVNRGDGSFEERGWREGCALDASGREQAGMGIAAGDLNGDQRPDLLVTNFSGEANALYLSTGSERYRERASQANLYGPSLPLLGWGTAIADLDLDGDLDCFVLNGHVYPEADRPGTDTSYAQPDQLYRNGGNGQFGVERLHNGVAVVSRAGALADLDRDGDLDLVALAVEGPVRVFLNRARERKLGQGCMVRLNARGKNRAALGARVQAEWEGGSRAAEMRTAGGFQAAIPAELHFGLGAASALKRVSIHWPNGTYSEHGPLPACSLHVIEEPAQ